MKLKTKKTLLKQFISRMLLLLVLISVVSGAIQGYVLYNKINEDTMQQASMIAGTIEHGITETDLASKNIEHQIDLKLELHVRRIVDRLQARSHQNISTEQLFQLRDEMETAGITIIAPQGDDFVNVKSTDAKDVGFSWKTVGRAQIMNSYAAIMKDEVLQDPTVSYTGKGIFTLFAAQAVVHSDKPAFFKYTYYHPPGTDYIISTSIEASEVYNFIQKVGTDTWIASVLEENPYAKEIAVLDPRVFANPSLEKDIYPPLKQVVYGEYKFRNDQDLALLQTGEIQEEHKYIQKINGQSLYKMFLPLNDGKVIYIALDYKKLSAPLKNFSLLLIVSGFVSLIALFMFAASFFNKIYKDIQKIMVQIKQLELGDLTAKSTVSDGGELGELSASTNKMTDTLNQLLTDTHDQATKAQRLSVLLETEANQSVEKVFTISMETTSKARESVEEIFYFIDLIEGHLKNQEYTAMVKEILDRLDHMRQLARDRTNNTTEITITLSDLFKSLHNQSSDLSDISKSLLQHLAKFKLGN
ncbi:MULTISPECIES: methyl-accepting chemotaxis protein [unclassified Paenibacillus]|uniref:methyl-accepting chemotaxis protein n=1 Tax=unclassified Paenibacillus TaxID=185978 RepID=UPI001AEB8E80|nr:MULTISPECIES: methyl-accepting chemotaxis protein [unclassified Paenibacillus]MBP1153980.1 methyl-accepting chemotaxis protein [Paenibacillus sp. PvP091]MBP1170635.1 methyl-accepting chemotaxis protein [Paenibacillus sp. PvR098]MBP2441663.1 methyl-accepting chemotaxis protein [Paenibacillus sp. PvP052]